MVTFTKKEKQRLEANAIRKCSSECYYFKNGGVGCSYYTANKVKFGESCLYELNQIKSYVDSFRTGDNTQIKEDAAGITGMLVMQIRRMLEQVTVEGVTVEEPMTDAKGQPVWIPDPDHKPAPGERQRLIVAMRVKDHPLIARAIQLARALDINLSEFKLTPKSADEKREVSGHVIAENPTDIKQVMVERRIVEEKFLAAIQKGTEMTKNDPVYQKLLADGEIVV